MYIGNLYSVRISSRVLVISRTGRVIKHNQNALNYHIKMLSYIIREYDGRKNADDSVLYYHVSSKNTKQIVKYYYISEYFWWEYNTSHSVFQEDY